MAHFRQVLLCIFAVFAILFVSADATKYTRFEDLPKCGRKCLPESIEIALKKADCGTELSCACQSTQYREWLLDCLGKNKPCDKPPTSDDVLEYNQDYYCNATSEQRVRYTVKVAGADKTLTLQADDDPATSHTMVSDLGS